MGVAEGVGSGEWEGSDAEVSGDAVVGSCWELGIYEDEGGSAAGLSSSS